MIAADILGFSGVQKLAVSRARSLARKLRRPVYASLAQGRLADASRAWWFLWVPVPGFDSPRTDGARMRCRLDQLRGADFRRYGDATAQGCEPIYSCDGPSLTRSVPWTSPEST